MSAPDLAFRLDAPATSEGRRRAVLLVHGLTGAPAEMRYLGKRLHRDGFSVSAPLLAGHGGAVADLLATTWRDWLDSVVVAHDVLAAEADEVHVAGICVGGLLALALAHARPSVACAAAYSVTLAHDGWSMPKWIHRVRPVYSLYGLPGLRNILVPEADPYGVKNPRLRARMASALDAAADGSLAAFPCGAVVHQYRLGEHVMRVAPAIRTPVLMLHATEDDQCRPRNAERLAARLPHCDLRWMHDSYHMMHVDQERAEVAAMTSRFFRRSPFDPAPPAPAAAAPPVARREPAHA